MISSRGPSLQISLWICRLLIALFPQRFRLRYGDQIERDCERLLGEAKRREGGFGLVRCLTGIVRDALLRSPSEHWDERQPLRRPRRATPPGEHMGTFFQELRYSVRSLFANPGYTIVSVLTLALAIAANAVVFSLVDAVLLQPLPFEHPNRLVALWDADAKEIGRKVRVSSFNYLQWKEQSRSFERIALYAPSILTFRGTDESLQRMATRVAEDFFPALGVQPFLGRTFTRQDYHESAPNVVILSHSLWVKQFGADRQIIGQSLHLSDNPMTVIGVLPRQIFPIHAWASGRVEFSSEEHFWLPFKGIRPLHSHVFGVLALLRPEVDLETVRAEMSTVASRLEQEHPQSNQDFRILMVPLREELVGEAERPMAVLLGAVILVLAIACTNVACLTLVRAESRRKELAVRAALGAGRWRLFRQFSIEATLLALLGGALGVVIAIWGIGLVPRLSPGDIPRLGDASLDLRVIGLTLVACLTVAIIFGLASLLQIGRRSLESSLREGRSTGTQSGSPRLRLALVTLEMTMAVVLATGSILLIRSFQQLTAVNPGFQAEDVLTLDFQHLGRTQSMHRLTQFYDRFLEEVEALPRVKSAGASYDHPLESNWSQGFSIVNAPLPEEGRGPSGLFRTVTPGYFATLGIPVLQGRGLTVRDVADSPGVAVVNEALAKRYFPQQTPIGQKLSIRTTQWMWGDGIPDTFEIVGVVGDVRSAGPREAPQPAYYIPYAQTPQDLMTVFVRTDGDPKELLPAIKSRLRAVDPDQPIAEVSTLGDILFATVAQPRFSAIVLSAFAAAAVLLSIVGLWGVLSDTVRRRFHEIGIRMALGANRGSVFRLTLGLGLRPVLIGTIAGLVAAWGLSRFLQGLLFEVSPTDPATYALVCALLLVTATAAALLPARKAARTDPLEVLRSE